MILHEQFIKNAKQYSSKMAIIDKTTGRNLTYGKTLIASLILKKKFHRIKEGIIGVMLPNSAGCILTVLAINLAGKIPAMINYSTGAAENCIYAQKLCGFKTIITSRAFLEKIECPEVPGMVCIEDVMKEVTLIDKLKAAVQSKMPTGMILNSVPKKTEDDTAAILFTSGSEKNPKAVQLSHRNFVSNIEGLNDAYKLGPEHKILSMLPLFHVFGFNANFWFFILNGMSAVTYANPLDYKMIPRIIRKEKISLVAGTPVFLAGYYRQGKPGDFESIKILMSAADKTPDWLREGYMEKHGIQIMEAYGTTETSPGISVNTPDAIKPGSIGRPLLGVKMKIVDVNTGEELGDGETGKILVKGDNVMKGYFDDLEQTSLRITNGWYDTGDMGYRDADGFYWHSGRLRRFVKIGGEMVSLVQTEDVLESILPDWVSCCVVEVPHSLKGAQIVAAVTEKIEDMKALKKQLQERLPQIALPKQFIVIPDLPKMGSGKVDFRTITQLVAERLSVSPA